MEKGETAVVNTKVEKAECPWGHTRNVTQPCSLTSVMDEEIAKELQTKENMLAGYAVEETSSAVDISLGKDKIFR